ncbi:uncharacterized protein K489DRAFT_382302 [Dissoconium aciculare CBS 342.82]|uniref:Uncharacterized protein n=1 Tax=Dissoconium aciculare CBS 342.82 TaxID=1314786 RepID=A0A6J3M173_9PEZI|nr:uncharacterized protein K489DRAFT_382302 [Dissoconium aciculare CBS 342.82]KAF1821254.1 hypothetical protein K489DRAFT_382302 [Dissoconium aciculare CBS 342.82]
MQQAVHLFWHHTNIQDAKHDRLPGRWWQEFGSRLTHLNIENIQRIHLMFPVHNMHQVFERENSVANMVRYVKPKIFRVTNRYHDWPASDWRDGSYRTTVCERQVRRQITMLLDACSVHVKKFQLALEVLPREREGYAAFFGTIRRLKKKLEMTRHSYDADPVVSYLCVVDEPRSWRWRRRRSTNRFDKNDKVTESKIELRVLELEWIRVCEVAESLLNTKANIITEAALHISSSHMFAQPSGVAERKESGTAQKVLLWQQRHVQQHSQKLHNAHEAQCRKLFTR